MGKTKIVMEEKFLTLITTEGKEITMEYKEDEDNFYFMCWSEYMDHGHEYIISKSDSEIQSYNKIIPPAIPSGYFILYGKYTSNENMELAQEVARNWHS